MPNVNGKKFPYTAEGMKAAKKAAKKTAVGGPKQLKNNMEQRKTKKMAPKKNIGKYGQIGRA